MTVTVSNTGIFGIKFTTINPLWQVTNEYIAKSTMGAVLNRIIGQAVFGDRWMLFTRKYPVVRVLEEYIVVFDASER